MTSQEPVPALGTLRRMARAAAAPPRQRRTQEERSAGTQKLLLDATVECLIDLGYAATTTTVIAERANVSRGAQLHHFPTKAALMTAALEHLARQLGAQLTAKARTLRGSGGGRTGDAIDALWAGYATPLFQAWLELLVAARTDADLRRELTPLEQRMRTAVTDQVRDLFGLEALDDRIEAALRATVYLLQGMALERAVGTTSLRERQRSEAAALALWKQLLAGAMPK
jgi:AcrR family transcriptional regulator